MALADTAQLIVQLRLDDKLTPGIGRTQASLNRLQSAGLQTGRGVRQLGEGLARVGTIAGTVAAGGIVTAAKVAGDFEASLNTINTVARVSQTELTGIGESIRALARDTGTGLNDLTAAYYDLVSAGVDAADAQRVLTDANTLAIGGLATTEEAVDLLTTAMNSYGLTAEEVTVATDQFAQAIAAGKVTAADLAGSFAQVAPIAAASKIEIDELAASYAQLTAQGVPAAEASTQVRSAIVALTRRTSDLEKLEKQTGKNYLSIAGNKGLVVALQQLRDDADKAGIPLIDLLGRVEGLNFTLGTTGPNFDAYVQNLEDVRKSSGLAAEQMAERQQGLNFQLARLKALATDAGITIGSALLPKLTPLVEKLNTFLTQNQDKIAAFGEDLAEGFERFSKAIPGIVSGLGIVARVGQKVVDIFLSLPPGLQSALVAGFAINKLSGGLIGSGLLNAGVGLTKIGIELFRGRGQTPANPLFVSAVGGGLGGLPGGAGGLLGKLGGALGFVGIVTAAVTALDQLESAIDGVDFAASKTGHNLLDNLFGGRDMRQGAATPIGQFVPENRGGVPVKVTNANSITDPITGGEDEATRAIRQDLAKLTLEQKLTADKNFRSSINTAQEFIRILRRTSEFGEKGKGTTIEQGPRTGRDPVGNAFVALVKRLEKPALRSNVVQGEIDRHIQALEEVQSRLLEEGNVQAAKQAQRNIDELHKILGTEDKANAILKLLRAEQRSGLSVANRRLADGNARQREIASRVSEARDRIGSGFSRANEQLGVVARKDFSPSFHATIPVNVTATLSAYQSIQTSARIYQIHAGTPNSGFQPRTI